MKTYYYEIRLPENEMDTECSGIAEAYSDRRRNDQSACNEAKAAGKYFLHKFNDEREVKVNVFEIDEDAAVTRSIFSETFRRPKERPLRDMREKQ